MNNNDFKQNVHLLIDKEYEAFVDYQKINLNTLKVFDALCRRNSIKYGLAFGTLLGAVRDNQQIPWDFDIDVFVPYTDYDAFIEALEVDLPSEYYYVYHNCMDEYTTYCLRVAQKGYSYHALHIDVYFVIGCPSGETQAKRFAKMVSFYCKYRPKIIKGIHRDTSKRTFKQKVAHTIFKCITLGNGEKMLNVIQKKISSKYKLGTTGRCIPFDIDNKVFPDRIFSDYIDYQIGNVLVKVPIGYEEFLEIKWGNYLSYLPVKSCFEEFWEVKKSMDELQDYYRQHPYK